MSVSGQVIDFNNTEIAFKSVSTPNLIKAKLIFQTVGNQFLATKGPRLLKWALEKHFPISPVVRYTIFNQFCGGVTVDDCMSRVKELGAKGIGSILDYSAEGLGRDEDFEESFLEILRVIKYAAQEKAIPFIVFKVTGLGPFELLEKMSEGKSLSASDEKIAKELRRRVFEICSAAANSNVRVLIDAEESWIQNTIDDIAFEMMSTFNKEKPIIYNTVQMYRHDRLAFLQRTHKDLQGKNCITAFKVVRGAYMEKERARALSNNYPSPIQATKEKTDADYDTALKFCIDHLDRMAVCAGTHNEKSSAYLVKLLNEKGISTNDTRVCFSQLLGMSDHISFNLSLSAYNVAKYVPYGPVAEVLPYLIRRARENTSVKGQTGRELSLIMKEKKRRAAL
jgi:proline dehydrogenase